MKTYFIRSASTGRIKIGRSKNPENRLRDLATAAADELELLGVLEGDREVELHAQFAPCRYRGKWFDLSDGLADFLRAAFGCMLQHPSTRPDGRRPPVETWHHMIERAEEAFGVGLRRGEHDEYADAAYTCYFRLQSTQHVEEAGEEVDADPDAHIAEEIDHLIGSLQDWWPWVLGWAFVDKAPDDRPELCLLFKKPGTPGKINHLCSAIAGLGADAYGLDITLRVAVAVRRRSDANEWIGDILGPATFDDEAELWGSLSPGGIPTPMIVDAKFGFQLLGDTWYRQRGLPTPAEQNLVV